MEQSFQLLWLDRNSGFDGLITIAEQQVLVLPLGPGAPLDLERAARAMDRVQLLERVASDRTRWQLLDAVVVIPWATEARA